MKIVTVKYLIDDGDFSKTPEWLQIEAQIREAISSVVWPLNSESFYINPIRQGSGVKPIKNACMAHLQSLGWELEARLNITGGRRPGPIDAIYRVKEKLFCVEWETGNIASSHRALNKICVGMIKGHVIGGILILPTHEFYQYLTDRVGNYEELEPYFTIWEHVRWTTDYASEGLLGIIAIEHDHTSELVPTIPKGTNGWAQYTQDR